MNPIIAQLLIAAFQALVQAIEAKLSHEERTLVVVDPGEFKTESERAALELVTGRAILMRHFGPHDAKTAHDGAGA